MSLFAAEPTAPLAVRMRPRSVTDLVGQQQVLSQGSPLRRLLEGDAKAAVSVILWGPPGTGKTTIASLVAQASEREFVELSAISSGVKDVRDVVERAQQLLSMGKPNIVLFIDEVHRFNKTQQDALLPAVENGWVTLIAATTENPSFSVNAPLLSRSLVVRLSSLSDEDITALLDRALTSEAGLNGSVQIDADAKSQIIRLAGGDARNALTLLEAAAGIALAKKSSVDLDVVSAAAQRAIVHYDKDGDQHYDVVSAFIKSMRGSDVDASLHYLARMIEAGEDPRFIARRIVILASEDIGMADPSALQTAIAAHQAVSFVGMPEATLTLAHAVVHCALAPKSNAVTNAIGAAVHDVQSGKGREIPAELRDAHYVRAAGFGHGINYKYPHDYPSGVVEFSYLPEDLQGSDYYLPTQHGAEARWAAVVESLRTTLRGQSVGSAPQDTEKK
jgi:putative ATPase